jgi:citrate synthase
VTDRQDIVTGLGKAEPERVLVCGYDLNEDLLGKTSFAGMTSLVLRGRLPTPDEARMLDALLIVLVEHGMVSAVVAARLVYNGAPEAIQAAVAAGLCGAGSVQLGSSEWSAKMLSEALATNGPATDLDTVAAAIVDDYSRRHQRVPGIGHRTHTEVDPRAGTLLRIARDTGAYGKHCELVEKVAAVASQRRKRQLPVNVTGVIGAIALDMGFPWQIAKAFALIGRTLGIMGHIAEEMRNPMAPRLSALIKSAIVYEPWRTESVESEGTRPSDVRKEAPATRAES